MKYIIALFLLFISSLASANDLDFAKITGKYSYEQYQVEFRDGRVLRLSDLGARSATIEFNKDATIVMNMNMLNGKVITANARITEIHIKGAKGYWLEKWPDMNYSVRKNFSFHDDIFEYEIKFENKADQSRYGAAEHAVLRKLNAF